MKKILYIAFVGILFLTSCENSLDLFPLSQPSAEKWYSNETEIQLALNEQYRDTWWNQDEDTGGDYLSDDGYARNFLSPIKSGTVNSQWSLSTSLWTNSYKAIARVNRTLVALNSDQTKASVLASKLKVYIAEARFFRAAQYARLVTHFGDVVYSDDVIPLEDAYSIGRTDKNVVLQKIYTDFDSAAVYLPKIYATSAVKRVTKGAAYALKARVALYMGDFTLAAKASKDCIDLGEYTLHPDYGNLFLTTTKNSKEIIFGLPRSVELKVTKGSALYYLPRTAGGYANWTPTWDLLCSYYCTDGLAIDKSPLFDPHNPFLNRDPRCTYTIVEFGSGHMGFIYDPNPYTIQTTKLSTGTKVQNNDNRANAQYASFNGLLWKKGIDETWLLNGGNVEPDQIIVRYADVLLMYSEAKTELGQIDQTVLDAVNMVRARAYKVAYSATTSYPAITTIDQTQLRKIIRNERRMEFASEGLRYMDLVRWKLASKVLVKPIYGMLDPTDLKAKVVDKGLWFFPQIPTVDADGLPDFKAMEDAGLIKNIVPCQWNDRQYLWPIPTSEIQINTNMKQNVGY